MFKIFDFPLPLTNFQGVLQGLVQGLTEFLPISSSGHLFLLEQNLGLKQDSLSMVLLLHGATLLSVLTVFFKDLKALVFSLKRRERKEAFASGGGFTSCL